MFNNIAVRHGLTGGGMVNNFQERYAVRHVPGTWTKHDKDRLAAPECGRLGSFPASQLPGSARFVGFPEYKCWGPCASNKEWLRERTGSLSQISRLLRKFRELKSGLAHF
jgi:hypothetical protein